MSTAIEQQENDLFPGHVPMSVHDLHAAADVLPAQRVDELVGFVRYP